MVAGAARHHGVDPQLALAISWQESGWQMGVVSGAHAIGAMQVLPSTARWMEHYAVRPLDLRKLGDNAKAGVLLLRVLSHHTQRRTHKIGAYYQGLGAVQRHGLYEETRAYVTTSRRSSAVSRTGARPPECGPTPSRPRPACAAWPLSRALRHARTVPGRGGSRRFRRVVEPDPSPYAL
ncbi:lytic transglycosylase domain-containing protein [Nocardioides sp.]|uniref:lytic transglycosylase domain-containing protein n=1 Tax=Nocardioides sp. TaxID=35761 RepID=UPI00261696DF|nr:lytic transglycosylase domain-containing protein [Nocardioides sp.]MCW2735940.1 LysM peptidoglycan-binding protein [Nocardioides sp.]